MVTCAEKACTQEQERFAAARSARRLFYPSFRDAAFAPRNSGENCIRSSAPALLNGRRLWNFSPEWRGGEELRQTEGAHMEMDSIAGSTELTCTDCGVRFRARRVVDGVEEICDGCYEKRFPALEPHGASLYRRRHSLAAD